MKLVIRDNDGRFYKESVNDDWTPAKTEAKQYDGAKALPSFIFVGEIELELFRENHCYYEEAEPEASASVWAMDSDGHLLPFGLAYLYEITDDSGIVVSEGICGGREKDEVCVLLAGYLSENDSIEHMQLGRQVPNHWSYNAITTAGSFTVEIW